jgi:hypothetical protein
VFLDAEPTGAAGVMTRDHPGEDPMAQVNPWQMAEECEYAAQGAVDPAEREALTNIRDLWIALANECPFLTAAELGDQIKWINGIRAELIGKVTIH